jgi:small multidrug resistance pump
MMAVAWIYLAIAIGSEVVATLELRELSNGIRALPLTVVIVGYTLSFLMLIPALRHISVGVSYAVWSAVGTAAVAIFGVILFGEKINTLGIVGLVLIVGGVAVLTASGSAQHG